MFGAFFLFGFFGILFDWLRFLGEVFGVRFLGVVLRFVFFFFIENFRRGFCWDFKGFGLVWMS